jgi:glycosyltransferase involved in cell wall biosynthesis
VSGRPLVSVLLPCYEAETYLPAALDSLLAQTYGELEILAIDDGSRDGTAAILAEYAARDERIRVLVNAENRGLIPTLNAAVGEARGELIARMDADDVAVPERIERQVELLERRPDVDVVGTAIEMLDGDGRVLDRRPVRCAEPGGARFAALFTVPVTHATILARAAAMRAHPYGESPDCLHAEDYELFARMLEAGVGFANLDEPLMRVRVNHGSVSQDNEATQVANFVACSARHLERTLGLRLAPGAHRALVNRIDATVGPRDLRAALRCLGEIEAEFREREPGAAGEIRAAADLQRVDVLIQAALRGRPATRAAALGLALRHAPRLLSPAARRYAGAKLGARRAAAAAPDRAAGRPRVVYVSYDGAAEPLGRSQVLAYLTRLAPSCEIALVSFEKGRDGREEVAALLAGAGIEWVPLPYHRHPPVLSTLWDVLRGSRAVRRAVRARDAEIVHVRSYVPALIALLAAWPGRRRWRLLFDIRGFWADERALGGGRLERTVVVPVAKRCERRFFAEADAVVTLTAASVPQIREWTGPRPVPVETIPTCAELERFGATEPRPGGPHAVWCGSIGGLYRFDLAVRFADALGLPLTVLTRQVEAARAALGGRPADVREVPQEEVAGELHPGDVGLCFYADGFANLARAPTRFAEYLAAGMAVAVTPGIGDLSAILNDHNVGVVLEEESEAGLARAAAEALALAADPALRAAGPRLAAGLYSADAGAAGYLALYRRLA